MAGCAFASQASAAKVFDDPFAVADGTALAGRTPPTGGAWTVTVGAPLTITGQKVDTTGARRVIDAPFTRALATGETLTLSVNTAAVGGNNFFSAGFAGFRLMAGGVEKGFFGDTNDDNTGWDLANTSLGGNESKSGVNTSAATAVLFYTYNTGVTTLVINGTRAAQGVLAANSAIDDIQIENNNGGDIKFGQLSVDAAVPEPASLGLLGAGAWACSPAAGARNRIDLS